MKLTLDLVATMQEPTPQPIKAAGQWMSGNHRMQARVAALQRCFPELDTEAGLTALAANNNDVQAVKEASGHRHCSVLTDVCERAASAMTPAHACSEMQILMQALAPQPVPQQTQMLTMLHQLACNTMRACAEPLHVCWPESLLTVCPCLDIVTETDIPTLAWMQLLREAGLKEVTAVVRTAEPSSVSKHPLPLNTPQEDIYDFQLQPRDPSWRPSRPPPRHNATYLANKTLYMV